MPSLHAPHTAPGALPEGEQSETAVPGLRPDRKEIARYLLSRGVDREVPEGAAEPPAALLAPMSDAVGARRPPIAFPDGLVPTPNPLASVPARGAALPDCDVVVITWTVDEADGLAKVFTPGRPADHWYPYARRFGRYAKQIRPGAPAHHANRLGSYMPVKLGSQRVLCMKSELHLNQDGISERDAQGKPTGRATLPVKDLFKQIITETGCSTILTIGTAGSVFDDFRLGDVVVTRAAKFRLQQEFRNEPFNESRYTSDWTIPRTHFDVAEQLMQALSSELAEPEVGPPSPEYGTGDILSPEPNTPRIRLDGRDMDAFHPILTTDYFEYGTTTNRLDQFGAAVEMGDAALGLACTELDNPPNWAVVRNMSDPVINGRLPSKAYHLNEQTTWAVAFYTAYGMWTSVMGALATWAVIAGL
jgi:nucleoside phosphorylase